MEDGPFRDECVTVHKIPIYSQPETAHDAPTDKEPKFKKRKTDDRMQKVSIAYVCKFHPLQRNIDKDKLAALDLPVKYPLYGQLKTGETITLEDGRMIKPDDVLSDAYTPRPIIVIECPSAEYLGSLMENEEFRQYYSGCELENDTELVIHFSPLDVFRDPQYQEWIKRFSADTKHVYFGSEDTEECALGSMYSYQAVMNQLDNDIFPLLPHHKAFEEQEEAEHPEIDGNFVKASFDLTYIYRPDRKKMFQKNPNEFKKRIEDSLHASQEHGTSEILKDLKKKIEIYRKGVTERKYPEIIFLGTGSSEPNSYRNVSSILVHLSSDTSILLDCGEGTYGQLTRFYGDKVDDVLAKLKAIYISHSHADHYMGTFGILLERKKLLQRLGREVEPILLVAGDFMIKWIRNYRANVDDELKGSHRFFSTRHFNLTNGKDSKMRDMAQDELKKALDLHQLETTSVLHCKHATGVRLTHKDNWSLVYSGDTMPSNNLVKLGKDCDILIHEATHADGQEEMAKFKRHSTTGQAVEVGQEMNAKFTILTHISQRYCKVPLFSSTLNEKCGFATDFMRVRMTDLPLLPTFQPAIKAFFADEYEKSVVALEEAIERDEMAEEMKKLKRQKEENKKKQRKS